MNSITRAPIQIVLSLVVLSFPAFGQATTANPADASSQAAGAASSVTQPETGTSTKAHDDSYVIGNDDHLSINVWKEPDLTKSIPVRSDGKISLPLVGEMQASGRTPLQL
jgi:polysaccharide export outer membrane protein